MHKLYKWLVPAFLIVALPACQDDTDFSLPDDNNNMEEADYSDVPRDMLDGYTVSFQVNVTPMAGGALDLTSRATGESLREIERFVDLEKLRVLFFTCLDDNDEIDASGNNISGNTTYTGTRYETGKHDIFLFEAKSRWVSQLSTADASDASYQVTAPVFTYGNNDDYEWDEIRAALCERPFKIVILANRPDSIRYSDFDQNYGKDPFYYGNKGPYWGLEESKKGLADFQQAQDKGFNDLDRKGFTRTGEFINGLHHCQWDPVYANKNYENYFYDFILKEPTDSKVDDNIHNRSGAVTSWTQWMTHQQWEELTGDKETFADKKYHYTDLDLTNPKDKSEYIINSEDSYKDANKNAVKRKPMNFYTLPDKTQGIPMYGVQKFKPLGEWKEGEPINVTLKDGRTIISLLRSLARIELYIPVTLGTVTEPCLMYSNVFGRCEPMDVATPTNRLMSEEHDSNCEFNDIYAYGPIINNNTNAATLDVFLSRMAWFYGIWRFWGWNYSGKLNANSTYFTQSGKPSPHVFNPCIQRNGTARLEFTRTTEDQTQYYHYVIYTGERNINDPSNFTDLKAEKAEFMYFKFNIGSNTYFLPINPMKAGTHAASYLRSDHEAIGNLKKNMVVNTGQDEWNYPILRNHAYSFRVVKANNNEDLDGLDAYVITSEHRTAPNIIYY